MKLVLLEGTAGSGKSLLASRLDEYYTGSGASVATLNLDPGAGQLPYRCDVNIRDVVSTESVMREYGLGPNGAVVMASDIILSKLDWLQAEIDAIEPDYLIVDTPGQVELLAYRVSGPLIVRSIYADERVGIFLYDGTLVTSPTSFVSIMLLASSIRLRLGIPMVGAITKIDLARERLGDILEWSSRADALGDAIARESDGETYSIAAGILRGLDDEDLSAGLVPVSCATGEGMELLEAALNRIVNLGEEAGDA